MMWIIFEIRVYSLLVVHLISPDKVKKNAINRYFLSSLNLVDLIEVLETWDDTAKYCEVIAGDIACDKHGNKNFHEHLVYLDVKALEHLVTECEIFSHIA